ncbi:hypothetical protein BRC76_05475 [Halobacteriales archaeon QH_8_67_36]|nr:MAG: hypothetical protein BRC76_05475 [Halobacteriales archaeon QH_8_67_36]
MVTTPFPSSRRPTPSDTSVRGRCSQTPTR